MQVNLTAFNLQTGVGPTSPPYDFFATGGGFSNYFTPPSYQQEAVSNYLSAHNDLPYYIANAKASNIGENGGVYNRAGRGYPDVAANGAFLLTYVNLTQGTFFGTSLASPIFGSVITLINEERTVAGKGTCRPENRLQIARLLTLLSLLFRADWLREPGVVRSPVRVERHHQWLQSQLWILGLRNRCRMGSCDRYTTRHSIRGPANQFLCQALVLQIIPRSVPKMMLCWGLANNTQMLELFMSLP